MRLDFEAPTGLAAALFERNDPQALGEDNQPHKIASFFPGLCLAFSGLGLITFETSRHCQLEGNSASVPASAASAGFSGIVVSAGIARGLLANQNGTEPASTLVVLITTVLYRPDRVKSTSSPELHVVDTNSSNRLGRYHPCGWGSPFLPSSLPSNPLREAQASFPQPRHRARRGLAEVAPEEGLKRRITSVSYGKDCPFCTESNEEC